MGSKEEYEARKAEREKRQAMAAEAEQDVFRMMDMFDRCATALERIADALETKANPVNLKIDYPSGIS